MKLSALNDTSAKPVDWWFAYKLPVLKNPKDAAGAAIGAAAGTEYLYCDAISPALPKAISVNPKILEGGALFNTLQQLQDAAKAKNSSVGWFFYNDEHNKIGKNPIPGEPEDKSAFGHTKGVLAFDLDSNTAFWILHSWPCYPSIKKVDPPSPEFGQTFLCITLKDVATADKIAGVFHRQTQPQIIGMNLPKGIDAKKYANLVQMAQDAPPAKVPTGAAKPETLDFTSLGGAKFTYFAKSKDWGVKAGTKGAKDKDLYSDFIGPTLGIDLEVETWQDGEPDEDSDQIHSTDDIQWIDLRDMGLNYAWHFLMHDHSKWAVSKDPDTKNETDWVIVADINRIQSQFNRGGGGIAFQNKKLARSMHSIIRMVPPPEDEAVIEADAKKAAAARKAKQDAKTQAGAKPAAKKAAKKAASKPAAKKAPAKKAAAKKVSGKS